MECVCVCVGGGGGYKVAGGYRLNVLWFKNETSTSKKSCVFKNHNTFSLQPPASHAVSRLQPV